MALPWIKLYGDLPTHRKAVVLAALTGDARAWTHVVELWLWVSRHAPDGNISDLPDAAIAAVSGWRGDATLFAAALRQSGFLDGGVVHGWTEHNGAHQRKQCADRARNERKNSDSPVTKNNVTSESLVNDISPTTVESRDSREDKEQEKDLALFARAPSAAPMAIAPRRRGRPPKDQSPEAEAERHAERADGEAWIAAARALIGLTAEQAPWSQASWMAFRQARRKRGIAQLLAALDALSGDQWARRQGLAVLLSSTVIEKGLSIAAQRGRRMGTGINAEWEQILADGEAT